MIIILVILAIIILFTWNIHFYTNSEGKDVSIGKFIFVISFLAGGIMIIYNFFSGNFDKPGYEMNSDETNAYLNLRVAISQSTVDGSGTLTYKEISTIRDMVKNIDSSNQWLSNSSQYLYGVINDTYDYDVVQISDGTYYASFKVIYLEGNYYLTDYKFLIVQDPANLPSKMSRFVVKDY